MKALQKITLLVFVLIQTIGYSQTDNKETSIDKQTQSQVQADSSTEIDQKQLEKFVGTYFLSEGDFELEIVKEDDKMFIVSPFSKDPLVLKNKTTLYEPTRGVDLALIENNKNALKFTQNGYETIIKRTAASTN